jgi:Bacterial protein of unknown function (DUF899)
VHGLGVAALDEHAAAHRRQPRVRIGDVAHRLVAGRQIGLLHLVCYLRDGGRVFETYWTTRRGAEAMDHSYALTDLSVYGRQETWEDSLPAGRNRAPSRGPSAARPPGRQCPCGRAGAPSPSGRAWQPGVQTTWPPPGADRQEEA